MVRLKQKIKPSGLIIVHPSLVPFSKPYDRSERDQRPRSTMQISLPILLMLASQATAACDSYATTGSTAAYYKSHRFYDFRNLPTDTGATPVCSAPDQYAKSHCSVAWSSDWKSVSWQRPTFQYTPSDVSISMSFHNLHNSSCPHSLPYGRQRSNQFRTNAAHPAHFQKCKRNSAGQSARLY